MAEFRSGYVALVGRPNVGKSTIMNRMIGQKISITSRRPQTTRHRILGIKTDENVQIVFVDTPGLHAKQPRAMNRYLNRAATDSLKDVDVVVFVVDSTRWHEDDEWVLEKLKQLSCPVIVAINKIDRIPDKAELLPCMQALGERGDFSAIIPVCARRGEHLDELEEAIVKHLPASVPFYPEDQVTDRSERFLAAELVREKLFRKLGDEIPYGLTVEIESFKVNPDVGGREGPLGGKVNPDAGGREGPLGGKAEEKVLHIHALIWVEKSSQKPIVIGHKGALLKAVGKEAREDMQKAFDQRVFLQLWVKVKEGWADDDRALRSLGYQDH